MVVSKKNGIFTLNFGEDEPILRSNFSNLVGSTTNQETVGLFVSPR